jgi:hypothetical protein
MRLGCGAGFSSDRLEPAVDLAARGALDVLIFETIGERTLAFGQRDRQADPSKGYNPQLGVRMRAVLPHTTANKTQIITNMGVANVACAGDLTVSIARELGLQGLKVAMVFGDDVSHLISPDTVLFDHGGRTVAEVGRPVLCANAYIGAEAILEALGASPDVVLTGRVADPSMLVAPLVHKYGWALDNWDMLGQATMIGHLMECGMQVTGGYFADPGVKDVPDLANCGYPFIDVGADGNATLSKLDGTGGLVSGRTVREQLLYEVHDPTAYLTPDVTADFSGVQIEDHGDNRVSLSGARGRQRPDQLKVTVAFDGGLLGEAEVSYAGPNALARARLGADILDQRLTRLVGGDGDMRIDLIGLNALHATAGVTDDTGFEPSDVRVRVAMRSMKREAVEMVLWETEALLCCGPAGGGGYRGRITPSVITHSTLVPRDAVRTSVEVITA